MISRKNKTKQALVNATPTIQTYTRMNTMNNGFEGVNISGLNNQDI